MLKIKPGIFTMFTKEMILEYLEAVKFKSMVHDSKQITNINQVTEHHNCSIIININALQNPQPPVPAQQEQELMGTAVKAPLPKQSPSFEAEMEVCHVNKVNDINVFRGDSKEKPRTTNTTHYNSRHESPDPGIDRPTSQGECRHTRMEEFRSLSSSGPRIKMNAKWLGDGKKS